MQMNTIKRILTTAAVASCLSAPAAHAATFNLLFGYDTGGDELATTDSGDSDDDLLAGDGLSIEAGLGFHLLGNDKLDTELSVGYKRGSIEATNGDVTFTRVSANAMQFFGLGSVVRLGVGATYQLKPELEATLEDVGGFSSVTISEEGEDVLGFVAALDFKVSSQLRIGLRATQINYEFTDATGITTEIDGNSAGLFLNLSF